MTIKMEVLESIKNDIGVQDRARALHIYFQYNFLVNSRVNFLVLLPRFLKDLSRDSSGFEKKILWKSFRRFSRGSMTMFGMIEICWGLGINIKDPWDSQN